MPSLLPLVIPTLLLTAWELSARNHLLPPSLSASPSQIVKTLCALLVEGTLAKHLITSLYRIIVSVTIGTLAGVLSGLLTGQVRWIDRLLSPTLQLLAPVPVVAWMPFVIMLVGSGELYKLSLAVLAAYLIIHMHTLQGVKSVPRDFVELAEIYEKTTFEIVRSVLLPASMRAILTGFRLTLAIAWIVIFFVEFGSARQGTEGLGWFIADARALGRIEDEYAGVLLLAITGALTDYGVVSLQRRLLSWSDSVDSLISP